MSTKKTILRAKKLRRNQTPAEAVLWSIVRGKRFHGLKFKRQEPYGKYYLDFYCESKKVVIEVDGDHHAEGPQLIHDQQRTIYLQSCGLRIIRLWNEEVLKNIDGIYRYLENEILGN